MDWQGAMSGHSEEAEIQTKWQGLDTGEGSGNGGGLTNSGCSHEGNGTGLTGRGAGGGREVNSERKGEQQGGSQVSVWMGVPWGG